MVEVLECPECRGDECVEIEGVEYVGAIVNECWVCCGAGELPVFDPDVLGFGEKEENG